jgi:hypothetical protein
MAMTCAEVCLILSRFSLFLLVGSSMGTTSATGAGGAALLIAMARLCCCCAGTVHRDVEYAAAGACLLACLAA